MKIFKPLLLVALLFTLNSCSEENALPEANQKMIIQELYSRTSDYLNSSSDNSFQGSFLKAYQDMAGTNVNMNTYRDSYGSAALASVKFSYDDLSKSAENIQLIIATAEAPIDAVAELDLLINDLSTSLSDRQEYLFMKETILFLDDNNEILEQDPVLLGDEPIGIPGDDELIGFETYSSTKAGCGWWKRWGKCAASIVAGALAGAGGGCLGGAQVGALITAPSGPGAAGGAAAGCAIGAVGGAIAGGLGGAVAGCDGC